MEAGAARVHAEAAGGAASTLEVRVAGEPRPGGPPQVGPHVHAVGPVGGGGGVHHLDEDDGVDLHHDVVLGDHLLARHVEHLLHHVHLAPDAVEDGRVEVQAGARDRGEAAAAGRHRAAGFPWASTAATTLQVYSDAMRWVAK